MTELGFFVVVLTQMKNQSDGISVQTEKVTIGWNRSISVYDRAVFWGVLTQMKNQSDDIDLYDRTVVCVGFFFVGGGRVDLDEESHGFMYSWVHGKKC